MIDAEVKVFNRFHATVAPLCAKGKCVSTIINEEPTGFPAVSLIEMSNVTVRGKLTSVPAEGFSRVMYQLEVFATTKSKCREVYAVADDAMIAMNFIRISGNYIGNAGNTKVFRYVARYEAMIDHDGNIYRTA